MKIGALNSRTFYYFTAVGAWLSGLAVFAYFASTINNFPGEVAVATWMQSWRTPWLDTVMRGISFAGIFVVAAILLAVVAIALYARGWRKESLLLIAATGVSRGVIGLTQELVARPRPSPDVVDVLQSTNAFAFPSGHVTHYVVFFSTLVAILTIHIKHGVALRLAQGLLALLLIGVGLARMYLGMHWLGDVIGGYAIGGTLVFAVVWLWLKLLGKTRSTEQTLDQ